MIDYLNWDSHFFKLKIGKAVLSHVDEKMVAKIINEKESEGYDVVYLFTSTIDSKADAAILKAGGLLADQKVTYTRDISADKTTDSSFKIRNYDGLLTPALLKLALQSGHESRFNKDARLQPKFELLYKIWIEKSLSGEMANCILAYEEENTIKGFVTLKKEGAAGQIGLIAVSPELHGKGIGKALMASSENWYISQKIKTARVVTQKNNVAACKLYEKSGYYIEKTEIIYHL